MFGSGFFWFYRGSHWARAGAFFGLGAFVVSACLLALAPNYAVLVVAALIGGVGNSIFHPVDYSIINHRVSTERLGHAYSVHGFTGYLGWAATPLFILYCCSWL